MSRSATQRSTKICRVGYAVGEARRSEDLGLNGADEPAHEFDPGHPVPGVDRIAAWGLVAEMGINMEQFPSAKHAASWGGVCPGNHESAGKRLGGRTRKGNPWLRRILGQSAWAAARTKNTYVAVQFRRLAAKRGRKRAIVAIGHSLLVTGYNLLRKQCMYQDLGADYFDRINAERLKHYLVKRLESLGQKVTLEPRESAA
jgi:transposase